MGEYFLMHKDIQVALLEIDEQGSAKLERNIPENEKHFPIGARLNNSKFSDWWKSRYIPDNRDGIKKALENTNYKSTGNALIDNLALSLNDCYWIKPRGSTLSWADVSLYSNNFDDPIGESLFNSNRKVKIKKNKYDVGSSSGELKKKWIIDENGKRLLIKGNIGTSYQQSLNEVFISRIHNDLNPQYCLQYELKEIKSDDKKILCCVSENFCNEHAEFVSASEIISSKKLRGSDSVFLLFKQGCIDLGMSEKEFHKYMDYLIMTDFLFSNIDRHLGNVGILRDPDTLKLIGFAPIFDSGNSMFYNKSYSDLENIDLRKIKTNSFYPSETKMLKCVKDFNSINLNKVKPDFSIYKMDAKEYQIRYELIENKFYAKLEMLKGRQKKK